MLRECDQQVECRILILFVPDGYIRGGARQILDRDDRVDVFGNALQALQNMVGFCRIDCLSACRGDVTWQEIFPTRRAADANDMWLIAQDENPQVTNIGFYR